MNRIRVFFAILLGLLFFPVWRFMDVIAFIWPSPLLYSFFFFFVLSLFVATPLKLALPKFKRRWLLTGIFTLLSFTWWSGPLSPMATIDPAFAHCGRTTYAGLFYPARSLLSAAFQDDLEAHNQLCWIKKLTTHIPEKFEAQNEFEDYLKLIDKKLILPEHKFRVSLPLIAYLHGVASTRWEIAKNQVSKVRTGAVFLDKLHFWHGQYNDEISSRRYSWLDWPMGPYMQFEYGLIEKNWEKILNSLKVEP